MTPDHDSAESAPLQLTDYRLRQRDYLLRIARAITERLDLRDVLTLAIRSAVAMTGGQAGAIAMRKDTGTFEVAVSYRLQEEVIDHLRPVLDDIPHLPAPSAADEPPDRPESVVQPPTDLPDEAHQRLALPLAISDEVIGHILVFRGEGAAVFTPLDSELLRSFADQAAVAIQNAQLHEQLAARERQLAAIVEANPTALLLMDRSGRVVAANPALAELTGTDSEGLIGAPVEDLIPLEDESGQPLTLTLPTGPAPAVERGYLHYPEAEGKPYVQVTVTGQTGPEQTLESYVASVVDLTAYKETEDTKRGFLAGMSHELKTPLSLIRGYAETLRYPKVRDDDELYAESLDVILTETETLTRLVERLLQAARLEAGGLRLDIDQVNLGPVIEQLVEEFSQAHPGHQWQVDVSPELPVIAGDRLQLRQVLQNLLANAVKYSPDGTNVHVTASPAADGVRVSVRDEGAGMTAETQQHLFERFYRASDEVEGAGLGLYMSRAIVEAHGGTISAVSAPGEGSTFTVVLPQSGPQTARDGAVAG